MTHILLDELKRLEVNAPKTLGNVANRPDLEPACAFYNESKRSFPVVLEAVETMLAALVYISAEAPGTITMCRRADDALAKVDALLAPGKWKP